MSAPPWDKILDDTFIRANAPSLGNNWTPGSANSGNPWSIVSNRASMSAPSGNFYTQGAYRQDSAEVSQDQQIELTLPANSGLASGDVGVYLRRNGTTYYLAEWTPYNGGKIEVFAVVSNVPTSLSTGPWNTAYDPTHSYRLRAYCYNINPTILRIQVFDDTLGTTVYNSAGTEFTNSTPELQTSGGSGMVIWNTTGPIAVSRYQYYIPNTAHYECIGVGDSLMSGTGFSPNVNFFASLAAYAGSDWTFTNLAVGGRKVSDMITAAPGNIASYIHRNKKRSIVICEGLTNDIATETLTATAALNRLKTLCQLYRAGGAYVLVPTIMPADGVAAYGYPADFNAQREAVNALIIAQWQTFADGLVNMSADPFIGVSGAEQNPTYFGSDKVHPTDAGHQRAYTNYYLPAFQALNTALDSAPIEAPTLTLTLPAGGGIQIATNLPRRAQNVTVFKNGVALGTSSAAATYNDSPVLGPSAAMPIYTASGAGLDNPTSLTATSTPFQQSTGTGRVASITRRGR